MMDVEEIGNLMRYRGGVHYWGEYFIVFFPHVSEHIDHYKSIKKITHKKGNSLNNVSHSYELGTQMLIFNQIQVRTRV